VLVTCAGAPFEASQPYNAHNGNNCRAIPRYNTGATGFAYVPKDRESLAKSVLVNPTVIAVDATRLTPRGGTRLLQVSVDKRCQTLMRTSDYVILAAGVVSRCCMNLV
jgi:hypothetical protein